MLLKTSKKLFLKLKRWNHQKSKLYLYLIFSIILFCLTIIITKFYQLPPDNDLEKQYNWIAKHRNLSPFLNKTYATQITKCKSNTDVLVAIISTRANFIQRRAIRNSWTKLLPPTWTVLFFIGNTGDKTIESTIKYEKKHKDIVELNLEDSYLNLTLKSILMMEWVKRQCEQSRFLLKADDDIYISPHNMQRFVGCFSSDINYMYSIENKSECSQWNIKNKFGHFINKENRKYIRYIAAGYLYEEVKCDRNPAHKWYLSPSLYSDSVLPDFLSGTSYLLSSNIIPLVLNSVIKVPLINLEDVYITGLIINKHLNLKLSHINEWNNFRPQFDDACLYNKLLSVHGLKPVEMIYMNNAVANLKEECSLFRNMLSYMNTIISYYIPRYSL